MTECFLITGGLGCIGAWTARRLLAEGAGVVTYDLPGDPHRLRLIIDDDQLAGVTRIDGDVTDLAAIEQVIADHQITEQDERSGTQ